MNGTQSTANTGSDEEMTRKDEKARKAHVGQ